MEWYKKDTRIDPLAEMVLHELGAEYFAALTLMEMAIYENSDQKSEKYHTTSVKVWMKITRLSEKKLRFFSEFLQKNSEKFGKNKFFCDFFENFLKIGISKSNEINDSNFTDIYKEDKEYKEYKQYKKEEEKEIKKKVSEPDRKNLLEEKAEDIFRAYPKRKSPGKSAAVKAIVKILADGKMEYETLLGYVQRYASSAYISVTSEQFIPMCATWMNQKKWEEILDDPTAWDAPVSNARAPSAPSNNLFGAQESQVKSLF